MPEMENLSSESYSVQKHEFCVLQDDEGHHACDAQVITTPVLGSALGCHDGDNGRFDVDDICYACDAQVVMDLRVA